jgi:hypothetical protein
MWTYRVAGRYRVNQEEEAIQDGLLALCCKRQGPGQSGFKMIRSTKNILSTEIGGRGGGITGMFDKIFSGYQPCELIKNH